MNIQSILKLNYPLKTCLFFIILAISTQKTLSIDPKFEACAPKSCGNGPNISYPFWLSDHQDSFCGYPNFEINCSQKNPVLTISNDDYIIKEIHYSNYSFLVANAAVYDEKCPVPLHNFSLDRAPFSFSSDHIDYSFYYNCTSEPSEYMLPFPVDCYSNDSHHSFAAFHEEELQQHMNYSFDSCQSIVHVPVHLNASVEFTSLIHMDYVEILKMGFLLNWTVHSCSSCERSGGRCGFETNEFVCFCNDRAHKKTCDDEKRDWGLKAGIGLGAVVLAILLTCLMICCFRYNVLAASSKNLFIKVTKSDRDLEAFIRHYGHINVKRYRFSHVKKMTRSFKDKLGQGGYGEVYRGKLLDGCLVAVKLLNSSKGNGEDFMNEVASISRTSHVNVVTLLGFCLEGNKRALIYEFMPNGSLEKFILIDNPPQTTQQLEWEKLLQIATGIARGLEYLHRGCNTRILHFDIKPHNILLDEDLCPKISDFGLSKLCPKKESIIPMLDARGTIGYIAPEVWSRNFGGVSSKSDVYSYGMMILEMAEGRKNVKVGESHTSEIYFPDYIYKQLELNRANLQLQGTMTIEENEIARKMLLVGLWCIQTKPSDRPSMSKVIEMLEGNLEALQIPPKPYLFSPRSPEVFLAESQEESSTTSVS